jgi:hypothetical protein
VSEKAEDASVNITFINSTKEHMTYYWINDEGEEYMYKELAPGE